MKNGSQNRTIIYGINQTPFGEVLLAMSSKGLCNLLFINNNKEELILKIQNKLKSYSLNRDDSLTQKLTDRIFNSKKIELDVKGTQLQKQVWDELLKIPKGKTLSYQDIAKNIGKPTASRAIGNAIGANPIHYIIPCHRVIRKDGSLGGYAGGVEIKKAILESEKNL